MKNHKTIILFIIILLTPKLTAQPPVEERVHYAEPSTRIVLADDGRANFSVVTSTDASETVKSTAAKLTDILSRISGSSFVAADGNGLTGIAVGVITDFPDIPIDLRFDISHPGEQQGYIIKSHSNGVYIIGATPLAVEYAVFDFLYQLGYRQYFPMKKWEIIPKNEKLEFALHIKEVPDYYSRNIWITYGGWNEFAPTISHWNSVNRNGGYNLKTGHAYGRIINANRDEFDKHPEYFSLIEGKRITEGQNLKFCVSNTGLQRLVTKHALNLFYRNPLLESMSLDPSDGGGWCECELCKEIGTPSTRAVYLSNIVAQAVREIFQGKKIGMYAYNMHSSPPEIEVDQDVVVSIATRFIKGGKTVDDLIDGWNEKKAVLGIREYYDVTGWSKMLPGRSAVSDIDYLKKTIPHFYSSGVRYLSSEATDAWVSSGLGYYIADRLLWNVESDVTAILDDFFDKAFGPAAQTIREYFDFIYGSEPKVLASDPIGRMYRLLNKAWLEASNDNSILERIIDLVLYTRYVELYKDFEFAQSIPEKQVNFDKMMSFISGIKDYRIFHTIAIERGTRWQNLSPDPSLYITPNWEPVIYSKSTIKQIIEDGILNNDLADFEFVGFSEELIPVNFINDKPIIPKLKPRRDVRRYYTWVDESLMPIHIIIRGGLIAHYRDRGNVKVSLIKLGGTSETGSYETLIQMDDTTEPNGISKIVVLYPDQEGLYAVDISDGNDMTDDIWINYDKTFNADKELEGTFYFYVPKGTKEVGMYHKLLRGSLYDSDDNIIHQFNNTSNYQSFPVPTGQDGKIWSFKGVKGIIKLLNVPSYFSLSPIYFLLPKEVVEMDNLSQVVYQEPKLDPNAFVTIWNSTGTINFPGIGRDYSLIVRNASTGRIERSISSVSTTQGAPYVISGLTPGSYAIEVLGNGPDSFNGFKVIQETDDKLDILELRQWGNTKWARSGLNFGFWGCKNIDMTAVDAPNLSTTNIEITGLFEGCDKLIGNPSISNWDTSKVRRMRQTFRKTKLFNQPLNWDVTSVVDLVNMFNQASAFNQDLGHWQLKSDVDMRYMFSASGMDCENYGKTLIGWAKNPNTPTNRELGAMNVHYSTNAVDARDVLVNQLGWSIVDSGLDSECLTTNLDSTNSVSGFVLEACVLSDFVHFIFNVTKSPSKIILIDLSGRDIVEKIIPIGSREIFIPINKMPSGVYIAQFIVEDKCHAISKLVI